MNCSGETWKQETHQSLALATRELPSPRHFRNLCVPQAPTTSSPPPPTCLASPRQGPSCSPRRGCRGVGLPVGTRRLPRLGGAALPPRGSRWSTEVVKHEKSSRSRGFMADLWERVKANEGHTSWTLMRKYYSKHLSKSALDDHQNHS